MCLVGSLFHVAVTRVDNQFTRKSRVCFLLHPTHFARPSPFFRPTRVGNSSSKAEEVTPFFLWSLAAVGGLLALVVYGLYLVQPVCAPVLSLH